MWTIAAGRRVGRRDCRAPPRNRLKRGFISVTLVICTLPVTWRVKTNSLGAGCHGKCNILGHRAVMFPLGILMYSTYVHDFHRPRALSWLGRLWLQRALPIENLYTVHTQPQAGWVPYDVGYLFVCITQLYRKVWNANSFHSSWLRAYINKAAVTLELKKRAKQKKSVYIARTAVTWKLFSLGYMKGYMKAI